MFLTTLVARGHAMIPVRRPYTNIFYFKFHDILWAPWMHDILDGSEIPTNHLTCMQPWKWWDVFISTGQPEFFPSTLSFAEILKRPTHIKLRVDFHFWSPTQKKNYIPKDIKSISSLHHLIFKENLGGGVTCVLFSPLLWSHEWRLKKTLTIRPMVDRISHCWWPIPEVKCFRKWILYFKLWIGPLYIIRANMFFCTSSVLPDLWDFFGFWRY